jgi:hypothetical protein
MSALILAPDHDPFAFLNCNPDYRTAAKVSCGNCRNSKKPNPNFTKLHSLTSPRSVAKVGNSGPSPFNSPHPS